jgi:hypothetical protein
MQVLKEREIMDQETKEELIADRKPVGSFISAEQQLHNQFVLPILDFIDKNDDAKDLLKYIKDRKLIKEERLQQILDLMLEFDNKTLNVVVEYDKAQDEKDQGAYMHYLNAENKITLIRDFVDDAGYGDEDYFIKALLHEYIHAYTSTSLQKPITKEQKVFAKKMQKLYEASKSVASEEESKLGGFKNVREFVSDIMVDTDFIDVVRTNQKYNWWQKFIQAIAKLFKIDVYFPTTDESVFDLVMDYIPTQSNYDGNLTAESVDYKPLKSRIYEMRETLDISDRKAFEKELRNFETKFSKEKGGIRYKDTRFVMLGVSKVMDQFGFDIDPQELEGNQKLEDAIKRGNAVGSVVHGTAESILRGQTARISNDLGLTGSPSLRKDLDAILERFRGQDITIMSEIFVADLRKGMAGYIDMVIIDENDEIHLYDFKSKEQGFSNFSTKYTNQVDGSLKHSAEERAHAQLTLYKEMFQTMTGYTVSSTNAVLLKPTVDNKKVSGVKLDSVRTHDTPSRLGESIYEIIGQVNMNIDPDMALQIAEQRLAVLEYQSAEFSKLDNVIEKVLFELENRLKIVKNKGNILEAQNLEKLINNVKNERTSSASLATLLKGGLKRTADIIKDYERLVKEDSKLKIGQLFHWKEVVEAYEGFQEYAQYLKEQIPTLEKEAKQHAKQIEKDIEELGSRIRFISNLYTEKGMESILDFLVPRYNKIRSEIEEKIKKDYRELPPAKKEKETEVEFINRFFRQAGIEEGIEIRTRELLREELKKASRDIGAIGLWISNVMDSRDPVIASMVKGFAEAEYKSHKDAISTREDIVKALREFEKGVNTSVTQDPKKIYDSLLEKDKKGEYTGYLIDKFNSKLYTDYNKVVKDTRALSLDQLKKISEDKDSQINKIAEFYYNKNKGKNKEDIDFDSIEQDIRKKWKDERTIFDKENFNRDKGEFMREMFENGELTEKEILEIQNNDIKFLRGDSDLSLLDLANKEIINYEAAEKLTAWIFRNAWSYRHIRPAYKEEYENPNYEALLKGDKATLELYELLKGLAQDANDMLPYSSRIGLRLPGVIKNSKEMLRAGDGLLTTFKESLKNKFTVRSDDEERDNKEVFSKSGKPRYFLPIHYTGKVKPELQSYDLPTIIFKFWRSANDFNIKSEILPEMELAKHFIETREYKPTGSNKIRNKLAKITNKEELKSSSNNLAKQLNEWFMTSVYSLPKKDQGKFLGLDVAKFGDAINNLTSLTLLGVNVIQGTANTILGETLQIAERVAGEYMSPSSYRKGTAFYMNNFFGIMNDVGSRSPNNVVSKIMDEFDILDEPEGDNLTSSKKYRALFSSDTVFFTTFAGEHEMQGRFLLSMLVDKQAFDSEGKLIGSMLNQYEVKDGKLVLNKDVDLEKSDWTEKDQFEFSYKVRGILSRLHGEYTDLGRMAIQRGALGRMAAAYRKFIEPGFQRRWGKADYVERLGDTVEGSYRTFFSKFLVDLWNYKFNLDKTWNDLNDHQKANVKRTLTEAGFLLASMLLLSFAVTKLKDVEDDDEERRWAFLAYQAARLKTELLFFISPPAAWDILRSPMASMSVIENFIKITEQLVTDPFERYERGPWKGKPKLAKYAKFYRLRDVRDQLAWFTNKVN